VPPYRVDVKTRVFNRTIDFLFYDVKGPSGKLLVRSANKVVRRARAIAPRSKTGSHGRQPGYMARRIYRTRVRRDRYGPYVDIIAGARTPARNGRVRYGAIMNAQTDYLGAALGAQVYKRIRRRR
jgi:hypothetical protein